MAVPTFVDLQGFIVDGRFVVKEVAVLRKGTILSHYIFGSSTPQYILTKSDKSSIRWLVAKHHGLRTDDEDVPYSMAKQLILKAVADAIDEEDDASHIVYVNGSQKCDWLADFLDENTRADVVIETLDIDYEDIKSLNKLDVVNTLRCRQTRKALCLAKLYLKYSTGGLNVREKFINKI